MDPVDHLSESELVRFYRGELDAAASRRVVRHLLTGCRECRERSAGRWGPEVARRPDHGADGRFDQIFARAARAALGLGAMIDEERKTAPALVAELGRHPFERQLLLVANSRRFRTYGLAEALCAAAFGSGFRDPRRAIEQARVALEISDRLPASRYGERLVNDLRARSWGTLGNAQRIGSRLPAAEKSIGRGLELAERGTGDPSERARLLSFLASLRTAQRRFDEALAVEDRVLRLYRELGDRHMIGRTEAHKAFVLRCMGEPEKAIELSESALQHLDPKRNARDVLSARQGLAHSLLRLGRAQEAAGQMASLRREAEALGNELDMLRCDWLEGKILHRQGRLARAETRLREVRDRFIRLEIAYDAALATLDLAAAVFDLGRVREVGRLLGEAIPLFRALGIHREAIAALAFLKQASELEQLTAGLIEATARFVEEARRNPQLRFRSPALTAGG